MHCLRNFLKNVTQIPVTQLSVLGGLRECVGNRITTAGDIAFQTEKLIENWRFICRIKKILAKKIIFLAKS